MPKRNFAPGEVLTATNVNTYLTGTRNLIINGAFDIWQRGTSTTSNIVYLADRWLHLSSAGTQTVSRSTDVPSNNGLVYSLSFASTNGTNPSIIQRIESLNAVNIAGQTATLSVWAKSTVGTAGLTWSTATPASTDTWTGSTADKSGTFTASMTVGTWTRYTATFAVSALASTGYQIVITRSVTTTSTTTLFAGIQLEEGSTATPFYRATPVVATELAACQRYYWRAITGNSQLVGNSMTYSSTAGYSAVRFPVTMRTAPTIEVTSGTNHFQFEQNGGGPLVSSLNLATFSGQDAVGVGASNAVGFSGTAGHAGWLRSFSADARLSFTAEL